MPTINQALGINPLVAGLGARAVDGSTAIGVEARSDNRNATAIGRNAQALGPDTTAIGTETTAPTNWNTVIGYEAGSFENGENVVIIGRKAEAQGNNGVAVGETARANGADATALGRNADALSPQSFAAGFDSSATAEGAIAIGEGTSNTVPDSVDIGPRDYVVSDGNSLTYPAGTGTQTLLEKPTDGSQTAGAPVGYTLSVGGQTVVEVFAEADGAGGVQNARLEVPVSLAVEGDTTQVDDVVTGDILVEDGSQVTQFRLDATATPPVADFGDNTLSGVGDISSSGSLTVSDTGGTTRAEVDTTTGDLDIEGELTETAAL